MRALFLTLALAANASAAALRVAVDAVPLSAAPVSPSVSAAGPAALAPLIAPAAASLAAPSFPVLAAPAAAPAPQAAPSAAAAAAPAATSPLGALTEAARPAPGSGEARPEALAAAFDGVRVERRLHDGRWDAVELMAGEPRHAASFALEDGVLRARVSGPRGEAPARLDRGAELARALARFGRGVRAVEARWEGPDGRAEFNALAADGTAPEDAAARTWIGRRAAEAGFTRVLFPADSRGRLQAQTAGSYTGVTALFVRPEDARGDRAGETWRRERTRKGDRGLWERWTDGARTTWLRRYADERDFSVYEYPGDQFPRNGLPAPRLAVFSLDGDVLKSYIVARAPSLIDPQAEFRAALAHFGPRVRRVEARWSSGNGLGEFKRLLALGLAPEDAAARLWLGRRAAEAGFTRVEVSAAALEDLRAGRLGDRQGLVVTFRKP